MITEGTQNIVWLSLTTFNWIVLMPLLCYCAWKFFIYRNNIILQKRHPTLTIIYAILTILSVCIERPIYLLSHTVDYNILTYIHLIVYHFTIFPLGYFLALRYWLIYFNVNWIKATINKKWKIHLNPITIQHNWFLLSKSTFGNLFWSLKRFYVIVFFVSMVSLISMSIISPLLYTLISLLFTAGPIIAIFYLFFKIRQHNDDFYIIKELKIICFLILFSIIRYIIIGFLPVFGVDIYFRFLFLTCFSSVFMTIYLYFQTLYIVYTINRNDNLLNLSSNVSNSQRVSNTIQASDSNSSISRSEQMLMRHTLQDGDLFESFMQQITREWSMELLLAFIEFTQLQNMIKKMYFDEDDTVQMTTYQTALLQNKQIPDSYIVHTKAMTELENKYEISNIVKSKIDKHMEYKVKSYCLYKKYIAHTSELQINISHDQRKKLEHLMNGIDFFIEANINEMELFEIYSDVINELSKLLRYSHDRFKFSRHSGIIDTTVLPF